MEGDVATYGNCEETTPTMMPQTIPPGHTYDSPQIIQYSTVQYSNDFTAMGNPYANNATADPNAYAYLSAIHYGPPPAYHTNPDPPRRDNERRGGRGRGGAGARRDYNRPITTNGGIQTSYMIQSPHPYNQVLTMCRTGNTVYSVAPPAHPLPAGSVVIPPPFLPQRESRLQHYGHLYAPHSHSPNNTKYGRGSQPPLTYYNTQVLKDVCEPHTHLDKRSYQSDNSPMTAPPFRHSSVNEGETQKKIYPKSSNVNNNNSNSDVKNNFVQNSAPSRTDNNKKDLVSVNRANIESSEVTLETKAEIVNVRKVNRDSGIVDGTSVSDVVEVKASREMETACQEEKITLIVEDVEVVSVEITDKANVAVEKNDEAMTSKVMLDESVVGKVTDCPSVPVPVVVATSLPTISNAPEPSVPSAPPASGRSWANILKQPGPPSDSIRSMPPPLASMSLSSSNSTSANLTAFAKTSSQDVTRNVPISSEPIRNNTATDTKPKQTEQILWGEKKPSKEISPQNNLNDPMVFRMGGKLKRKIYNFICIKAVF